ncbi:MAG: rubrerythrin family protein [Anaerolineales bacterium]|nr:rubrerythrin family protein [Anaerolineales bacterium]
MSETIESLKAAFAGESQANRRYLAYARKADEDGYPQVARLFRAVAAAETVHAHNHLRILGEINTTAENVQAAMAGENYEVVAMYPEFIKYAEAEEHKKALTSFKWALEVEKQHEVFFQEALEALQAEHDLPEDEGYYICPFCGSTHRGAPPEKCPVCGAPGKKFERVG